MDALVPDRVPDGVGQRGHVLAPVVYQHHVEITEGAELAPAVAADGQEGQMTGVALGGPIGQGRQPGVGLGGVGPAEGGTTKAVWLEECLAPIPERGLTHGWGT